MGFSCGIIGLPNVGKSTIFNALTSAKAASENFPFCTIEPNTGAVPVPDLRLNQLAEIAQSAKVVPTQVTFVDIAGLIKGASKGEGLGNQFLGHIRSVDAVAHVVRCFDDENIVHVEGSIDPLRDIETIDTELLLADLDSIEKLLQKYTKLSKSGDKVALQRKEFIAALHRHLGEGKPARLFDTADIQEEILSEIFLPLLTAKKILFVGNIDESDIGGDPESIDTVKRLKDYAESTGAESVFLCGRLEAELAELPVAERKEYLSELGLQQTGLDRLTFAGYRLLNLITFFTAGPKEARAWTAPAGSTAPQCAGKIHTDFEKGFIRAEVISYEDYTDCGGESGARDAGKLRTEGKEYIMKDGDVVHFRFNV